MVSKKVGFIFNEKRLQNRKREVCFRKKGRHT